MTPNMLNTYVADDTAEHLIEYALKTADMQNTGKMDTYIYSAIDLARQMNIIIGNNRTECFGNTRKLNGYFFSRFFHKITCYYFSTTFL